nr:Unknown Function [uncultured bacterium]
MTETEWAICTKPEVMRQFLRGKSSERKNMLFLTSSCYLATLVLRWTWPRTFIEVGERIADGLASTDEITSANMAGLLCDKIPLLLGREGRSLHAEQAKFLRCIYGNPFRPVKADPLWLTWNDSTIPQLARTIYEERDFDLLPILADALEDAGCTDAEMLAHCRGPRPHVRGCWVVDLLLGKR